MKLKMIRTIIAILLIVVSTSLGAAMLEWDYPYEDPRVTHFVINDHDVEIARTETPEKRFIEIELSGGELLTAYACSETTCSPPSNELWVPNGVENIRIMWGLE